MSKSGLFAHFGSKEELQLATIEAARTRFIDAVVAPTREAERGLPRLDALLDYMRGDVFTGGCFFDAVRAEYDSRRPGPVRDAIMHQFADWSQLLADAVRSAQKAGHLDPDAEAEQVAFELDALCSAANVRYQFDGDPAALERARRASRARIDALAAAH
jgi:AcrR family transcriptional regulator